MNEAKLAEELQAGGVALDEQYITTLLKHHDTVILVEVPWITATEYAMSDIMRHASFLLARMRMHTPKRLRVNVDGGDYISITIVE